jgi:hypothetical protein
MDKEAEEVLRGLIIYLVLLIFFFVGIIVIYGGV